VHKKGHIAIRDQKWLWGDNSANIQEWIIVLVYCPFPHCYLSINQLSLKSLLYFPLYGLTGIHYEKISG